MVKCAVMLVAGRSNSSVLSAVRRMIIGSPVERPELKTHKQIPPSLAAPHPDIRNCRDDARSVVPMSE